MFDSTTRFVQGQPATRVRERERSKAKDKQDLTHLRDAAHSSHVPVASLQRKVAATLKVYNGRIR
jgi:hypothetical protein